jgi:type III secretion protein C
MTRRMSWRMRIAMIGTACIALLMLSPVQAAEPPWKPSPVAYSAQGKPIRQVLTDIAATQPFNIVVDAGVRGDVRGEFDKPARQVFEDIVAAYDLAWFFDGSVLYVSAAADSRSEVVQTSPMNPVLARQALQRLGLIEARFPIRTSRGALLVTGPRRYVELVSQAIAAERAFATNEHDRVMEVRTLAASAPPKVASVHRQIMVFPLKHAQAQDTQLDVGDIQRTVPGVASILRALLDDDAPLAGTVTGSSTTRRLHGVLSEGKADDVDEPVAVQRRAGGIRIEADTRSNAVLVFDAPSTHAYYRDTIAALDKPGRQVRLDVAIIDIESSALRDLGVDLGLRSKHASGNTLPSFGSAGGADFQLMLGSAVASFTARISALEQAGKARVMSRPSVNTLDNVSAVIGNQSTAYARVAGANATDLFSITSGLRVDITPQIIPPQAVPNTQRPPPPMIRLFIGVQDGRLDQSGVVDGLPVSNDNFISTQARVVNGDTLLFGGYRYDHLAHEQSGVPGLRKSKAVGGLFRRTVNRHDQYERLFLVTPRIIDETVSSGIDVDAIAAEDPTRALPDPPSTAEPRKTRAATRKAGVKK